MNQSTNNNQSIPESQPKQNHNVQANIAAQLPSEKETPFYKTPITGVNTSVASPQTAKENQANNQISITSPRINPQPDSTLTHNNKHIRTKKLLYFFAFVVFVITLVALGIISLNYFKLKNNNSGQEDVSRPTKIDILQPTISIDPNPDITVLSTQGKSDEIEEIEKDLNATDLTNLDKELDNITTELNNSN